MTSVTQTAASARAFSADALRTATRLPTHPRKYGTQEWTSVARGVATPARDVVGPARGIATAMHVSASTPEQPSTIILASNTPRQSSGQEYSSSSTPWRLLLSRAGDSASTMAAPMTGTATPASSPVASSAATSAASRARPSCATQVSGLMKRACIASRATRPARRMLAGASPGVVCVPVALATALACLAATAVPVVSTADISCAMSAASLCLAAASVGTGSRPRSSS